MQSSKRNYVQASIGASTPTMVCAPPAASCADLDRERGQITRVLAEFEQLICERELGVGPGLSAPVSRVATQVQADGKAGDITTQLEELAEPEARARLRRCAMPHARRPRARAVVPIDRIDPDGVTRRDR